MLHINQQMIKSTATNGLWESLYYSSMAIFVHLELDKCTCTVKKLQGTIEVRPKVVQQKGPRFDFAFSSMCSPYACNGSFETS